MNKKMTAALLTIALCSGSAKAQSSMYDRIGHGQDSITCLENMSLYQQAYKAKDYKEAYLPWKEVFNNCKMAQITTYVTGEYLLENLILQETDAAKKKQYFDDLMNIFDQRLELLDQLNQITKRPVTRGNILSRKAYAYFCYGGTDNEVAYKMFNEGIQGIDRDEEDIDAGVLGKFFECSLNKYKADNSHRAQFLQDYLDCTNICDAMLSRGQEIVKEDSVKAQQYVARYEPTKEWVENTFATSGAADCASLDAIFLPKVDAAKSDLDQLNKMLELLQSLGCDEGQAYYKASDYAYTIKPTYESAIGKAQKAYKENKNSECVKYFEDAMSMAPQKEKGSIALKIAAIFSKQRNTGKCMHYANEALKYNPSNGKAHLLIAHCIAASASGDAIQKSKYYCLAIDRCNRARAVDPAVSGAASRQAASYAGGLCRKQDVFFNVDAPKAGSTVSVPGFGSTTMRYR